MKKAIVILLTLCLCVSLCACGVKTDQSEESEESNVVTLNAENISQYLGMKIYEPEDDTMKIEFYPLQGGSFSSAQITVLFDELYPAYIEKIIGATFESEDKYPREGTIKFSLPADGRYEIELELWTAYGYADDMEFKLQDAAGIFTPVG